MDLRDALLSAGFKPTACQSAAAGRRLILTRPFSLFVFDLTLGDGTGLDLIREVRTVPRTAGAPVIVISASTEIAKRLKCLQVGASDYIAKPYSPAYVVRRAFELTHPGDAHVRRPTAPARVLIVDDSATYSGALAAELRIDGHDVIVVGSGADAHDLLAAQSVDCIVLDVFLPDTNGVQLCRELRGAASSRDTPVLMLTGRKESVIREEAFRAGVNEFAVKSTELAALRVRVRVLIGRSDTPSQRARPPLDSAPDDVPSTRPRTLPPQSLIDLVVAASGLSSLVARSAIERACQHAGVDTRVLTPADIERALPHIQRVLSFFLAPEDAKARADAIEKLGRR